VHLYFSVYFCLYAKYLPLFVIEICLCLIAGLPTSHLKGIAVEVLTTRACLRVPDLGDCLTKLMSVDAV
jgi:hypothetical protein